MSDGPATPGAVAIHRAAAVLACFDTDEATLRLADVARATSLSPSTTHRLLAALVDAELLARDEATERYRIGPVVVRLGLRGARDTGLHDALEVLHRLTDDTGESATLAVRAGRDVSVLVTSPSPHRLRFDHGSGSRVPLHASAMGKVLLAFGDEGPRDAVAALGGLERYTPATITSRRRLVAELAEARERGWALNREERYPGVVGVAAPVRDADGTCVAAIGLQGPATRLDVDADEVAARVAGAAEALRGRLRLD